MVPPRPRWLYTCRAFHPREHIFSQSSLTEKTRASTARGTERRACPRTRREIGFVDNKKEKGLQHAARAANGTQGTHVTLTHILKHFALVDVRQEIIRARLLNVP
jgi:hypothetical protein